MNGLTQIDYAIKYDRREQDYEEGLKNNEEQKILWLHQRFDEIGKVQKEYERKRSIRLGLEPIKQMSSFDGYVNNGISPNIKQPNNIIEFENYKKLRKKVALKFIHRVLKRLIIIQRCTKRFGIVLEATNLELTQIFTSFIIERKSKEEELSSKEVIERISKKINYEKFFNDKNMKQMKKMSTKISKEMKLQTKVVKKVEKKMTNLDYSQMWGDKNFRKRFRILMKKPNLTQASSLEV